ncbi:MAG: hypothetical protein FJ098_00930, partial [Deltaproteobacteria bacterium]|nr:hypothetical protein [Deltaproteobacteria bacterium]
MKTITRLVPAFVLTALFLVPPGDAAPLQGHVALREDAVTARPAGPGSLELRFPVRNSTGEDVEVRWRVELRDLDGTRRGR